MFRQKFAQEMIECREITNEMSAKAFGAGKIKATTGRIDGRPEIAKKITDGILKTAMNGSWRRNNEYDRNRGSWMRDREQSGYGGDWQQREGQRWGQPGQDRYRGGMEGSGWQGNTNWQGGQTTGQGGWNSEMNDWRRRDMGGIQSHAGRGPRNYKRSDQRIEEDINEQLTHHHMIDATDVEVTVNNGEVTLRGQVDHRHAKRIAEDIAESVLGVKDVNNQIKIKQHGETEEHGHETETSGKRERKVS